MKTSSLFVACSAILLGILGTPFLAAAQTGINVSYLQGYSNNIIGVINLVLIPPLMAIAFIVFLWGVYKYFIKGADDEKSRTDGKQFVLWGIIGFTIIVSVWGIVYILMGALGLTSTEMPQPPLFNPPTNSVPQSNTPLPIQNVLYNG
ncbi:MAG TPA: hypothetical protein VNF51_01710 [Candidatus Paceibacterota bacterium]|nr:hypothetical protein [Candidatus Paceibacterota bacterium]